MGWVTHLLSILVILISVAMTIFTNYRPPPSSPILYQWKNKGSFFKYKNYDIFYIDKIINENSTMPALLCLHGFPTSSFDYYKLFPKLRRKFDRIVFIDFLGLGFSDKPRFYIYSLIEQATIVEKILEHLKLKDIHILAHDIGATVVQELVARNNEGKSVSKIHSIHLMNAGIFPEIYTPFFFQKLLVFRIIGTILSRFHNYYTYRYNLNRMFGEETKLTVAELHDFWAIARHNDGFRVFGHLLSYLDERLANQDRWLNALKITQIPLQFIFGSSDPVNPAKLFIEYYNANIPNPQLYLLDEKIGHYPNLEDPDNVFKFMIEFLQKNNFNY